MCRNIWAWCSWFFYASLIVRACRRFGQPSLKAATPREFRQTRSLTCCPSCSIRLVVNIDSKCCSPRVATMSCILYALRMIHRQHLLCRRPQSLIPKPQQVGRSSSARQTSHRNATKPANGSARTSVYRQSSDAAPKSAKPRPSTSAWALFSLKGKYGSGHQTDFAEFHSAVLAQLRLEHSDDSSDDMNSPGRCRPLAALGSESNPAPEIYITMRRHSQDWNSRQENLATSSAWAAFSSGRNSAVRMDSRASAKTKLRP